VDKIFKKTRMTEEEYIKTEWGENWLKCQWEAGDVIDALGQYAKIRHKELAATITDEEIGKWARANSLSSTTEQGMIKGAKAMRDGEIESKEETVTTRDLREIDEANEFKTK